MAYVRFIVRSHVDPIRLALLLYELAMLYDPVKFTDRKLANAILSVQKSGSWMRKVPD